MTLGDIGCGFFFHFAQNIILANTSMEILKKRNFEQDKLRLKLQDEH